MDLYRLIFYINILGICFPIALTYLVVFNVLTDQQVYPITIVILAFGYAVMIKKNPIFHELWDKWIGSSNKKGGKN